jgi:hypothetical protein
LACLNRRKKWNIVHSDAPERKYLNYAWAA